MQISEPDFPTYVAERLATVPTVEAVTLGGSRAYGTPGPQTDWDFGIYYRRELNIDHISDLGWPGDISPIGGWGGGIFNGGAILQIDGRRVDIHYRDLSDVESRITEAEQGQFAVEHLLFHLAGVPTYIVVAELALSHTIIGTLPSPSYPERLKQSASEH